jgi:radical SAM superfamily enzyme YgiQ (UPF0313 family)
VRSRVEWAFDAGLKRVKLYFLTGFEEETDEDIKATPEFVLSLAQDLGLSTRPQGFQFTVGLASLVPKPCTPFQRRAMEEESVLKRKMKRMLDPLRKHPRIEIESESPRASLMQGALSQGDRSLAGYLMDVAASRGPILKSWDEAMFKLGDHPMKRVLSPRKADEKLPWGFIRRPGLDL